MTGNNLNREIGIQDRYGNDHTGTTVPPAAHTMQAPEMSATGAFPAVLLLAGVLAVILGRKQAARG